MYLTAEDCRIAEQEMTQRFIEIQDRFMGPIWGILYKNTLRIINEKNQEQVRRECKKTDTEY